MQNYVDIYTVEDYGAIPYNLLRQIALLRWWADDGSPWEDDDEEEIHKDIDFMLTWKSKFDFVTFYVLAKTNYMQSFVLPNALTKIQTTFILGITGLCMNVRYKYQAFIF